VIAFIFGVILLSILVAMMVYIPEIYILVFTGFLYACIRSIRDDQYREKFIIKSERKLYFFIILSIIVIIGLILYFIIVDSGTLYFTIFIALCLFGVEVKRIIKSKIRNKEK
jgi:hypothetical protein